MHGGFAQEFIAGIGKRDDTLIILLNADAVLTMEERAALGSLDTTAAEPALAGAVR